MYTLETGGLCWVVTASGSIICPELYQKCRNNSVMAITSLIIGKLPYTLTTSFRSIYESARKGILRRSSVLFFAELLQLLVSLSVQNLLELQQLVFNCQNFPDHWEINIYLYTILQKYLHVFLGKREIGAGLGQVVTASGSVLFPELYPNYRNHYVIDRTSPLIGNLTYLFTPSFRSLY